MFTATSSLRRAAGLPPLYRLGWWARPLALLLLLVLAAFSSRAQLVSTYTFAKSVGTFTPLPAATPVAALLVDTGNSPVLPLGFTFRYDGVDYTSVIATSDGTLSFSPNFTSSDYGNSLATVHYTSDPLIAGLWDDLSGGQDPNSKASYITTGTAGNRVFTFEWLYWSWGYSAPTGGVSFQIKLYENGNRVEMVYRPESGALSSPSASVGLRSIGGQGPGSFLSVSTLDNTAVASNAVAQDNLTAKPTTGLTFSFTPTACSVPPTYATLPVSQGFEAAWTDACAPHNAAGTSWRTTPLTGDDSWRRDDDGASANWLSTGSYPPAPVASQGSHAAVFHSSYAPNGSQGSLDLYVNLSAAGTKVLTFDYNNTPGGNNGDFVDVLLSTDGGLTFPTTLLTVSATSGYASKTVTVPSTSATSVIRFRATGDYGYSDIGLDNVQLVTTACPPATNAVVSNITSTTASFTFTASGATSYTVTTSPASTSQTVTTSPATLPGLTPATVYTVSAVSNCAGGATSAPTSAVTFTTAPGNDLCSNATTLTAANTCPTVNGTLAGAQAELSDGKLDVWFKFTASDTEQRITVANPSGSTASLVTSVYAGACPGNATSTFAYNSSSGTTFLTGLTPTQVYYVRVYDFYSANLTPVTGAFTICLTTPYTPAPANDLCTAPQSLTPAASCTTITGSVGASHITPALDLSDDVWYSFTATSATHSLTVAATNGASLVTDVYSVNCPTSSTTPVAHNASTNTTNLTGLTPTATYYVRVSNFYTSASSLSATAGAFTICLTAPNNLTVSSALNVSGTYDNVTVTSTGNATLSGPLTVNQSLVVQSGGLLNDNCQLITGGGTFTLSAGGTISICHTAGIYATGAQGAVQVTGGRSFSPDGLYVYKAAAPQTTGPGLPGTVRELTVSNANNVTLNNAGLDVAQVLRLSNGNLTTAGLPVRLLSSVNGTALVDNAGGVVTGTVQVQRYVSGIINAGLGYRHLSAPVASPPVSQLGTSGSPVTVNPAFNSASAAVRPTIVPYPTVFYYNEANVTSGNTAADFDQGWYSPGTGSEAMPAMQGYAAQVAGAQTVTFSGTLNNGALSVSGQGYSNAGGQAGWHLLGNPYPSPIDWRTLTVGPAASNNLQNMSGAVYVAQSNGHYTGSYRTYQNGLGGDPVIASGQGFFVRTASVGQSGTLRLSNANRVTTWTATNSTMYRPTDVRPQLYLGVRGNDPGIASPDQAIVYTEAGATPAVDARYDAYKLPNTGAALNLYSLAGADELSINGLPELGTQVVTVPLGLRVPQAGTYIFSVDKFQNFGATMVYLRDALTGTLTNLATTTSYTCQVSAGALASTSRFSLELRPTGALATAASLTATQVTLFPNPAHGSFTVQLPALTGATTVTLDLLDALGRQVLSRTLPLGGAGLSTTLDVPGLATGVYSLRLTAGLGAPLVKRLVIE